MKNNLIKLILFLVSTSIIAGASAVMKVERIEERVLSQKEKIDLIYDDVKWLRNNAKINRGE